MKKVVCRCGEEVTWYHTAPLFCPNCLAPVIEEDAKETEELK